MLGTYIKGRRLHVACGPQVQYDWSRRSIFLKQCNNRSLCLIVIPTFYFSESRKDNLDRQTYSIKTDSQPIGYVQMTQNLKTLCDGKDCRMYGFYFFNWIIITCRFNKRIFDNSHFYQQCFSIKSDNQHF